MTERTPHHVQLQGLSFSPPRRDPVGLVVKLSRIQCVEFRKDGFLDDARVDLGNAINGMAAHDRQVGHADKLGKALLDDRKLGGNAGG